MIKRHYSYILTMDDEHELHQKSVDFLCEQMQRVEEYPYAVMTTYKYAKSLFEKHLALFPEQTDQAIEYLRLMSRASWYLMRLHFRPDVEFTGSWSDQQPSFKVRKGERETGFDYPVWYHGVMAAVILRDSATIRKMVYEQKILHLLETNFSPRDDAQFQAMFYEVILYYLSSLYERSFRFHQDRLEEVMTLKLGHLNHYAEILTVRYRLDEACEAQKFVTPPERKQQDDYYYHFFCHWMIPCLQVLNGLVQGDQSVFQTAFHKALLGHQRYWQREADEYGLWEESGYDMQNDHVGYFSFTLTALAALAHDRGFEIPLQSDYCPDFLVRYRPVS